MACLSRCLSIGSHRRGGSASISRGLITRSALSMRGASGAGTKTNAGHIGGHRSPKGYAANCEKYNLAAVQGWRVLRYTESMIRETNWAAQIQELIDGP